MINNIAEKSKIKNLDWFLEYKLKDFKNFSVSYLKYSKSRQFIMLLSLYFGVKAPWVKIVVKDYVSKLCVAALVIPINTTYS